MPGIRCIPERMGSMLYGNQHGRILVIHGSTVPHQLPRTIGCLPSPQDLCGPSEGPDLAEDGQCISSDIHQPKRGHTLNTTVQSSPSDLGVEGITLKAEHLPGSLNIVADMESRTVKDRCDWMINPKVFQQIQQHWR